MVVKPVKKFPESYTNLKLISPVYILDRGSSSVAGIATG